MSMQLHRSVPQLAALILVAQALGACAGGPSFPPPRAVISARTPEALAKLWNGRTPTESEAKAALPIRFDFHRGDRMRLHLNIAGTILTTAPENQSAEVVIQKDFSMILFADRPPLFSFDGAHWEDLRAFQGALHLGVGAMRDEGGAFSLGLELHRRE